MGLDRLRKTHHRFRHPNNPHYQQDPDTLEVTDPIRDEKSGAGEVYMER